MGSGTEKTVGSARPGLGHPKSNMARVVHELERRVHHDQERSRVGNRINTYRSVRVLGDIVWSKGLWRNSCRESGRHGACRGPVTPHLLHSPCRGAVAGEGHHRRFGKLAVRRHTSPPSPVPAGVSPFGGEHPSQDWIQAHWPLAYQQTEWAQNRIRAKRAFGNPTESGSSLYRSGYAWGGSYLQAIYADKAVSQACMGCHNAHPDSPKQNFKLNDVMGAIMVTVPLS